LGIGIFLRKKLGRNDAGQTAKNEEVVPFNDGTNGSGSDDGTQRLVLHKILYSNVA